MATTGATLITELARRLRDNSNTAHSRALLLKVLSHSQRAINMSQRAKKATATLTLAPGRTLYQRSEVAANVARIERIYHAEYSLPESPWRQLVDNDRHWYRRTGVEPVLWARVGGNLFVVYPSTPSAITLNITYTIVPADVVDGATNVDLPDELLPMVMDLAEGIMLAKARLLHAMEGPMSRLGATLGVRPPVSAEKTG